MNIDRQALKVASWLPTGKSGDWEIHRMMEYDEPCTELLCGDHGWMNDCQQMIVEHEQFCNTAHGNVVLTGLGIGYVPNWLVLLNRCTRIRIIENSPDVIKLVWPYVRKKSPIIELIEADANEWIPDWCDYAWIDHEAFMLTEEQRVLIGNNYNGRVGHLYFWDRM